MNAALQHTFTAVRGAALTMGAADDADRLATAWRISQVEVRDCLRMIGVYQRATSERDEMLTATVRVHSPSYVETCAKRLPWALSLYLEHVRRISEAEAEMDARAIAFARSSDDWRA
jgi:inorganic triphosphatase YgiF